MTSRNIEDHSGLPAKRGEAVEPPPKDRLITVDAHRHGEPAEVVALFDRFLAGQRA